MRRNHTCVRCITFVGRSMTKVALNAPGKKFAKAEVPARMRFVGGLPHLKNVGWDAQWKEMIEDPIQRIGRPRQLHTRASERSYISVEAR
jgi:hypothetical protein